jgi:hypothetical protein
MRPHVGLAIPELCRRRFAPDAFTATPHDSSEEKAKFCNDLMAFVASGLKYPNFSKQLYNRLSQTFCHIAHYSKDGFFSEYFHSIQDALRFFENIETWSHTIHSSCSARFTFCDAELAIAQHLRDHRILARYQKAAAVATEQSERAVLAALHAKYHGTSALEAPKAALAETPASSQLALL